MITIIQIVRKLKEGDFLRGVFLRIPAIYGIIGIYFGINGINFGIRFGMNEL